MKKTQATQESTANDGLHKRIVNSLLRRIVHSRFLQTVKKKRRFKKSFRDFMRQVEKESEARFFPSWNQTMPRLDDNTEFTGFDAHYVYHTAWAARLLAKNMPDVHHDFASDIRFVTIASAFLPTIFYDYRPMNVKLSGLQCNREDLTNISLKDGSVNSLSCMHVVEHIGLGRYGDPIDPEGDIKAIRELKRILKPGGNLYFVVPVGKPLLRFNAHRIYSFGMICAYFADFALREFALIGDDGELILGADGSSADAQDYGCGCFWFKKQE